MTIPAGLQTKDKEVHRMRGRAPFPSVVGCLALAAAIAAVAGLSAGCSATRGAARQGAGSAGVSGTVYAPAEGVTVYVYKAGSDPYGPADVILPAPTGPDGRFSIDLPPGEYAVVARKRANQESAGPMSPGDQRSEPARVRVGESGKAELSLPMNLKDDAELRSFQPPKEWTTAIGGTVRDADGKPVSGARVHVYTYVQMSERPKYVSERTGPDGKYLVALPKGGTYYLAARDRFGGPPRIGDLYGRYDEGSINPTGVVIRDGEKKRGIDIIVFRVW